VRIEVHGWHEWRGCKFTSGNDDNGEKLVEFISGTASLRV